MNSFKFIRILKCRTKSINEICSNDDDDDDDEAYFGSIDDDEASGVSELLDDFENAFNIRSTTSNE